MSRGFARAFKVLRQPLVIYEIIGRIILGPSVGKHPQIFHYNISYCISSQNAVGRQHGTSSLLIPIGRVCKAMISVTGVISPFALGIAVSKAMYENLLGESANVSFTSFSVFLGVAMSIWRES